MMHGQKNIKLLDQMININQFSKQLWKPVKKTVY